MTEQNLKKIKYMLPRLCLIILPIWFTWTSLEYLYFFVFGHFPLLLRYKVMVWSQFDPIMAVGEIAAALLAFTLMYFKRDFWLIKEQGST